MGVGVMNVANNLDEHD